MVNGRERRSHPRVKIKLPVVKKTDNGLIKGEIQDLSLAGAFICCSEMAKTKDEFHMVISTKGRLMSIIGEVVWLEVNKNKHKKSIPGMGVRFKQILNGDRSFLRQIIASHYSNRVPSWLPRIFRTNG
jgi:hypothetical protein